VSLVQKRLRCFAASGGKCSLIQYDGVGKLSGGASNLSQVEFDAYQKAKLVADPRNEGDWDKAIEILKAAGFEVFWD
jgi:hypothetical protein